MAYFIAPFIITSCYYVSLTSRKIFNKNLRLGFIILCSVIFISQIYINNQRLVRTKRVWTDNFVSWQDSKEYVENNSDSALVLAFTEMHYRPFLFYGPKNRVLNTSDSYETSQFCDLSFIDAKFKEGYNDIFVIGSEELSFRGSSENMALKQSIVLNKDCDHLCIYLKNNAGNQYKPQKYIYHFRLK